MNHKLIRLKGYIGKSGRYVYECSCGCLVEGWNIQDAKKTHEQLQTIESIEKEVKSKFPEIYK